MDGIVQDAVTLGNMTLQCVDGSLNPILLLYGWNYQRDLPLASAGHFAGTYRRQFTSLGGDTQDLNLGFSGTLGAIEGDITGTVAGGRFTFVGPPPTTFDGCHGTFTAHVFNDG